jgi:hypothetical protein
MFKIAKSIRGAELWGSEGCFSELVPDSGFLALASDNEN